LADSPRAISKILGAAYPHQKGLGGWITRNRPFICPFEELVARIPVGGSVLDVGCGVGIMSVLAGLCAGSPRVVGFDTSAKAIAVARQAVVPEGTQVSFQHLPDTADWPEGEFDTVLCIDVLHHVPPPAQRRFAAQLCRSTRPGGLVVFKDIAPRPRWKAFANRLHDLLMARQWVHYRHEGEMADWFQDEGMAVIERGRLDRLWYSHYLLIARKPTRP
jgi:2-polyprenyl-3-methyl-5-hydroxy-6-metoxy-1,4-benzoquinol methylase